MQLQGIFWHVDLDKTKHLKEECKKAYAKFSTL
jgi:hypothetical protein